MIKFLAVFLGGGFGAMARYFVTTMLAGKLGNFPIGTLTVNIFGSLFMGLLSGIFIGKSGGNYEMLRLLFAVGFCGGFSTLAAFSIETLLLFQNGHIFSAVINSILTFSTGLAACAVGFTLTHH